MIKRKKGTSVRPIKNPCLDCEEAPGCSVEADLTISAPMWRYGQLIPGIGCRAYREFFKKAADPNSAHLNQEHVSLREILGDGLADLQRLWPASVNPFHFDFLTSDQNKMLDLFEREGKTYREIARLMNLGRGKRKKGGFTISAIKSSLARARVKIRNHFSKVEKGRK